MLKPTDMGLTGRKVMIRVHKDTVAKKLETLTKRPGTKRVGEVALEMMDTPSGGTVDINGLSASHINEFKNYFPEVMGPVWSIGMIPGLKMSDYTYFSSSSNERLYDFKVFVSGDEVLVSNKQMKGGTNTLKPSDVVDLVNRNRDLYKKWHNETPFKVMEALDRNKVIAGPLVAISSFYRQAFPNMKTHDASTILSQMPANDVIIRSVPESIMELIKADSSVNEAYEEKGEVTGTMVNYIFEKKLVEESKNDPKYNDLFLDVTHGNVLFFKFDMDNRGKIQYKIEHPNKSSKPAALRSKNGIERRSKSKGTLRLDKLGFQP